MCLQTGYTSALASIRPVSLIKTYCLLYPKKVGKRNDRKHQSLKIAIVFGQLLLVLQFINQ